ncbi:MAG: MBG domain-containing protein [Rhizomicrobium sp.]
MAIAAANLDLLGAGASYELTDSTNNIGTLAANTGTVSVADSGDLGIGTVNGTAGVTSTGAVTVTGAGDITIATGSQVTAGTDEDVVLAAAGAFVNDEGSDAVNVSGTGRWLIYSSAPTDDTFGDLDSGNTAVWHATFATYAPGSVTQSGDRYIFAYRPTLTITTANLTKTYGNDATADVAADYSVSGLQSGVTGAFLGDTAAAVYSGAPSVTSTGAVATASVAGSPYTIAGTTGTLLSLDGYAISFVNGALTVDTRPITVTADGQTRHYGDANPALTYVVGGDGLANGDALSGGLATVAGATSNAGDFAITQGTLAASANYDLTYIGGVLTVDARPITVTADSQTRHYGDANPVLTYAVGGGGLVNGDALSGGLATAATMASSVGGYAITQGTLTDANNTNYDISYTGATLSVTVRPITVTADDLTRHYGDTNPALTYAVGGGGLVNGDALSGGLATSATTTSGVNGYAITQGTLAASANYDLTYVGGVLTVDARPITVTADDLTRHYGDTNPTLTYAVGGGGLVNGDALSGGWQRPRRRPAMSAATPLRRARWRRRPIMR